jgi:quercetin dioxygenase-like cupin family protein
MKYTVLDRNAELSGKDVQPNRLYVEDDGTLAHIALKPNAVLPAHQSPENVLFYVLEGSIRIDIGEESQVFDAETMVESPSNIPHALTNASGEKDARILVIKLPGKN